MFWVENNEVHCTQGDTFEDTVSFDLGGAPYVPSVGDSIRFAIASKYKEEPVFIQDIPAELPLTLSISAEKTKLLTARKKPYVYDIQLTTPAGRVVTFVAEQNWYSEEEVC